MKAMILAAGFGRRLMPLTGETPKPLLLIKRKPVIVHIIEKMRDSGFDEIIINLHHLGRKIMAAIGNGSEFGVNISYSFEEEILGTGGGIKKVENFFEGSQFFLVHNGDLFSDVSLREMTGHHLKNPAAATLCLVKGEKNQEGLRVIGASRNGDVVTIYDHFAPHAFSSLQCESYIFSGIQILTHEIFSFLPANRPSCLVQDGYIPMLVKGRRINAFIHNGFWSDIGSHEAYARLNQGESI